MLTPDAATHKDRTQPSGNQMQHRHFAEIARIIRDDFPCGATLGSAYDLSTIAEVFADALAHTNPRFDRARFLRACKKP